MHFVEIERNALFSKPQPQPQRLLKADQSHGVFSENGIETGAAFARVARKRAKRVFRIFGRSVLALGAGIHRTVDLATGADARGGFDDGVLGGELGLHGVGHYPNGTKKIGAVMRLRR